MAEVTYPSGGLKCTDAYDPSNRRVWKKKPNGQQEVYFYGVDGVKLGTYRGTSSFSTAHTNVWFAGRLIRAEGNAAVTDRLGSVVAGYNTTKYYPYGEERTTTTQDRTKFATYYRDATTALDYADQRYYSRVIGRFLTPDGNGGGRAPSGTRRIMAFRRPAPRVSWRPVESPPTWRARRAFQRCCKLRQMQMGWTGRSLLPSALSRARPAG